MIILADTATPSNNNFANITKTGTGNITLDVNASVDLSAQNLGAVNRYDVANSQTLTLLNTQLTAAMIVIGAGDILLNTAATANTDLSGINNDAFTGTITLNDSSADNTIVMSDKNDTVYLTSGNDSVSLGAGTNRVYIDANNLTGSDSINGGGTDILNITSSGSADMSGVSSVETVNLANGGVNLIVGANNATINGGSGDDTFRFTIANLSSADTIIGNGGTDTLEFTTNGTIVETQLTNVDVEKIILADGGTNNITVGSKNFVIEGGDGADTFNYAISNLSSADSVNGNGGTDILNITTQGTITAAQLTNIDVESITLANGTNTITVGATDYAVTGGTGNDTFNYAIADLSSADVINGVSGTDKIVFTDAGTINDNTKFNGVTNIDTIQFANGTNTITLDQNGIELRGGTGADTFNYAIADLTSADIVNGLSGTDTLVFTDAGVISDNTKFNQVTNIDTIQFANGTNTITLDQNGIELRGGTGADTFNYTVANLSSSDTIVGNGGTDTLNFTTAGTISAAALTNVDVENIQLADGTNSITVGTTNYNITGGTGADTFNYAIDDLTSSDTINGNTGSNSITFTTSGSIASADFANVTAVQTINFHTGNDTITIADNDTTLDNVTLNLGTGTNEVIYADIADLTSADKIVGGGTDTISFSNSGSLNSSAFTNISGIDTVNFFTGADTVTLSDNALDNVNLKLNGGSDIVNMAKANLSSTDTIDAGAADTDSLNITDAGGSYSDADFTNLSNFETLNLSDSGADTITLGGTQIQEAGFTTINARGGSDTVTITNTTGLTTVDGGIGDSDNLIIGADGLSFGSTTVTNFETITVNGTVNLSGELDSVVSNISVATGKTLTVNATDFDNDTIAIGGAGDVNITATATASDHDFANISNSGSGNIILNVNATLNVSAQNLGAVNVINIADGADMTFTGSQLDGKTMTLNTNSSGDIIINGISGDDLSNITLTGSGSITLNSSSGGTLDASSIDVSSFSGIITINDSTGVETIIATADNDTINVNGGADIITGGAGTDTLNINTTDTLGSISGIETIHVNQNNDLSGKLDGTVSTIDLANGVTLSAQSSDVSAKTITDTGTANMNVTVNANVDLSSTNIAGTLTLNDTTGSYSITGSANSDTLNLSSGNDTVDLGDGSDTIITTIENIDTNDNIQDTGTIGTDSVNFTNSGTIDSANIIDFSGIETLNMYSGDDTIIFADKTEFDNFRNELNVVDSGGNDTLAFGSTAVNGDLDFTNLDEFENLNLSSTADTLTLSGDEPDNINGLAGNDEFTLDFSNVSNIDGGDDTDTVKLTGNTAMISSDTQFNPAGTFANIEHLDITGLTLNTSDNATEFEFTDAMIASWTGNATGNLTLRLTEAQTDFIKFTDAGADGVIGGGDDVVYDSPITAGTHTYDLGNTTLTIESV